jgi:hypothetical protein
LGWNIHVIKTNPAEYWERIMKTGQIIHTFTAKDGREVILRTPKWEDIDDLLELINSLITS